MLDLMYQINTHYDQFTPSSRKIADYLLEHCAQAQYLSIGFSRLELTVKKAERGLARTMYWVRELTNRGENEPDGAERVVSLSGMILTGRSGEAAGGERRLRGIVGRYRDVDRGSEDMLRRGKSGMEE